MPFNKTSLSENIALFFAAHFFYSLLLIVALTNLHAQN